MPSNSHFRYFGASDPGRVRTNNEDAFHIDAARGIFLVVDGIGGQAAGEMAAAIAVERIRARLERQAGPAAQRVREAIALANHEILHAAETNAEYAGMACVLTLALIEDGTATVGHVGDSRLYLVSGGSIRKITRDHSPVGEREDSGELSEAEAMRHPRRNEVYRDVGSEEHSPNDSGFVDITEFAFDSGSALVICSDGLSDLVPSAAIRGVVERNAGNPEATVRELIEAANGAGGKDNVTVIVVEHERFAQSLVEAERRGRAAKVPWLPLAVGFVAGCVAMGIGAWITQGKWQPAPVVIAPRTIVASGSIAAAMAEARGGDTVEVPAGEYREQVRLKDGVTLKAQMPREVRLLAAPLNAGPAVVAERVKGARLSGFRILADAQMPLPIGILLDDASVEIDDVEVKGAGVGIEIRGASSPVVRASAIRDSLAEGILIVGTSAPWLSHNLIQNNKAAGVSARGGAHPSLLANTVDRNAIEPAPTDAIKELNFFLAPPPVAGRGAASAPRRPRPPAPEPKQ